MNKVILIGRTTSEIRYNHTTNGISFSRTTVAVERQNSNTDATDFIPVIAWRGTADFMNQHVRKGTLIAIEGSFTSSQYESREGNIVRNYEVTIDNVSILEPKSVVENRQPNPGYLQPNNSNYSQNNFGANTNTPNNRVVNQIQRPEITPNFSTPNVVVNTPINRPQIQQPQPVVNQTMNDFHSLDEDVLDSLNSANSTPNVVNEDNGSSFMFDLDNIDKLD